MKGLGQKLTLGLFLFVLVLGSGTAALVYLGFDRGQQEAGQRSREGLELQGRERLATSTRFESAALQRQFSPAEEFAQQSARYVYNFKASKVTPAWDPSVLETLPNGRLWDPRPERITDVIALGPLDDSMSETLRDSAALDVLFPTLFAQYPGTVAATNFRPIAAFFVARDLTTRYYPPDGALNDSVVTLEDVGPLFELLGPEQNPERRTHWSAPYQDSAGRGLVITAYTAAYDGDELRAVVMVNLSIELLMEDIGKIRLTDSGFAMYFDRNGELLGASDYPEVVSAVNDSQNSGMAALVGEMRSGQEGVGRVEIGGREYFIAYSPFGSIGGSFAQAAPVDELTAQAAVIEGSIRNQGDQTVLVILAMMAGLFLCGLVASSLLTRRYVFNPIAELERGTRRIAAGDYASTIPVRSNDELGNLATSFNAMAAEVRHRSAELEDRVRDRTRSLEDLFAQRDQRVRELEATATIASSLTLQHPLEVTLQAVAEQVLDTTAALACAIASFDQNAAGGIQALATVGNPGEPGPGFVDVVVRAGERFLEGQESHAGAPNWPNSSLRITESATSVREVPIIYREHQVGVLICWYAEERDIPKHDMSFVEAIADQVAIAIENSQLLAAASASAALEERQRLARELHDSVSQALYGIGLGARTARRRLGADAAPQIAEPVDYVLQLAETALAEMRALIFELRPDALEQEGLVPALERQLAAIEARYGVPVERTLSEEPDLSLHAKEALYRISQEGVHNALKHGSPARVVVHLDQSASQVRLEIRDDGIGFDPGGSYPGHLGLRSMEERAIKAGGTWSVESVAGQGACITVTVPLGVQPSPP